MSRRESSLASVGLRAVRALVSAFPGPGRRLLPPAIGTLAWAIDGRHRWVALENLALAMPELPAARRRRISRGCYRNLASALVDLLVTARQDATRLRARYEVEGLELLEEAEAAGRGVIMMSAHLGNWEAAAQFLALHGRPMAVVARPLDDPALERELRSMRERWGNTSIPKRGGVRQMMRALGRGGRLGLLVDQRVHPNEGKPYPFFGQPAYTTPLLANLALRTGAPIVPCFGLPEDGWRRCRVIFRPPLWPEGDARDPEAVDALTSRALRVLEAEIRRTPEQWLWLHRRWRKNPSREARRDPAEPEDRDETDDDETHDNSDQNGTPTASQR